MLAVRNLRTDYFKRGQRLPAVNGVDLDVPRGVALALVGESGSGKSSVALSIMRLIRHPIGEIREGTIELDGRDLMKLEARQMRAALRDDIGYVPQDPMTALDPLFTIGTQVAEAQSKGSRKDHDRRSVELLEELAIEDAHRRLRSYPHEFSGGMLQRVAIAIALAKNPSLLIADEPTTGLDVTTQLGILRLLDRLRRDHHLATIFVTHDLAVARLVCQQVAIMYGGMVVETGPIDAVMKDPQHPYTRALLDADPTDQEPMTFLQTIPGQPPKPDPTRRGCPFADRCPLVVDECRTDVPAVEKHGASFVRCNRAGEA